MAERVGRRRLDQLLVERGLASSRQQAQALLLAGQVLVNDQPHSKAGSQVSLDAEIRLRGERPRYVSRAGDKLAAILEHSGFSPAELVALDVGASTGGFTDCLLQMGARHVYAVDVGYGQLAWSIRQNPRVTCIERQNARHLTAEILQRAVDPPAPWPLELATIDVSFISLKLVLPTIGEVLGGDRPLIALIKPQFEAGREAIGKRGVVKGTARQAVIDSLIHWMRQAGYQIEASIDSPVAGPQGNIEHLVLARTPASAQS
ncbi:MAG: TlyA family RNA methyltransferase [Deltaproteobacteria bacterium]|nr:TlyA family RNA methyltransferase [Deltaproteobacteria bacterium]